MIQSNNGLRIKAYVKGQQGSAHLFSSARADDDAADTRLTQNPRNGNRCFQLAKFPAQPTEGFELLVLRASSLQCANGARTTSAKQSRRERAINDHADAERLCCGQNLQFGQPAEQIVFVLFGGQAEKMSLARRSLGKGERQPGKLLEPT